MLAQSRENIRTINSAAVAECTILAGIAVMLLAKVASGTIVYYINPRWEPLVIAGAIVLLIAAIVPIRDFWRTPQRHIQSGHILLCIPLLLGVILPARPLGADAFADSNQNTVIPGMLAPSDDDTVNWNLLQWSMALSVRGDELAGRPIDVTGFVYHDREQTSGTFTVARYVIICCTADSNGVRLPVIWHDSAAFETDKWVTVRGTLGSIEKDGRTLPAILAKTVTRIGRPEHPYLYP